MTIKFCPVDGATLIPFSANLPIGSPKRVSGGTPANGFYEGHITSAFCPNCGYMTPFSLDNANNVASFILKG